MNQPLRYKRRGVSKDLLGLLRSSTNKNKKMLRLGWFLFVIILMLQSSCCVSDDIQNDEESEAANSHEIVDSFSRTYNAAQYPWRLWNFPYYQPRIPQNPAGDGGGSSPLSDPRFVTNRCHSRQSYTPTTTYPCFTTYYTTTTYISTTTVTTTVYPTTTPPTTPTTAQTTTPTTSTYPETTTGYPSSTTPQLAVECGRSKFMSLSRITGGSEATPNEFPWMVRFLLQNLTSGQISTCAGTLVSDRHVITAPHCFYNSFSPLTFGVEVVNITLGAHDFMGANSSDQYRQFADWISMTFTGNFSNPMDNCINVITLRTPLILNDYVRPACLPFEYDSNQVNDTVVLTGWGAYSSFDASPALRKTVTTVVPSDGTNGQCQHGPGTYSSDTLICSDASQQRRYCKGDDGGPMNFYHKECNRWFVVGVAGRGDSLLDCQSSGTNQPNVYTRVRNQLAFIRGITGAAIPVDCQQASDAGTLLSIAISEQMAIVSTVKQPDNTTITTMTNPNKIPL